MLLAGLRRGVKIQLNRRAGLGIGAEWVIFAGDMKHLLDRFAVVFLSALIVLTSVGVAWVSCAHTGRISIAVTAVNDASHCDKRPMKGCMQVQVKKLSPSVAAPSPVLPPAAAVVALPAAGDVAAACAAPVVRGFARVPAWMWQGPPRSWLHIIRVLLI